MRRTAGLACCLLLLLTGHVSADGMSQATDAVTAIDQRLALERHTRDNPFVLTAHRPNYLLPVVYNSNPGQAISTDLDEDLQKAEFQFQLSVKILLVEHLYGERGQLTVAYTNRSFWQAYNRHISAAFRETNHEPELILTLDSRRSVYGFRNTANQLILNHQSNGQFGAQSRSWNRIMLNMLFERDNLVIALRPWYRIPESAKESVDDPRGDDNPDIERYLGHFEASAAWARNPHLYTMTLRNNLRRDENRGAIELGWSFPLNQRIKGFFKVFHGYGESLISYDRRTTSLGAGFLVSDWI